MSTHNNNTDVRRVLARRLYPRANKSEVTVQYRYTFATRDSSLSTYTPFPRGVWVARLTATFDSKYEMHQEVPDQPAHDGSLSPVVALLRLVLHMEEEILKRKGCRDVEAAMHEEYGVEVEEILRKMRKAVE